MVTSIPTIPTWSEYSESRLGRGVSERELKQRYRKMLIKTSIALQEYGLGGLSVDEAFGRDMPLPGDNGITNKNFLPRKLINKLHRKKHTPTFVTDQPIKRNKHDPNRTKPQDSFMVFQAGRSETRLHFSKAEIAGITLALQFNNSAKLAEDSAGELSPKPKNPKSDALDLVSTLFIKYMPIEFLQIIRKNATANQTTKSSTQEIYERRLLLLDKPETTLLLKSESIQELKKLTETVGEYLKDLKLNGNGSNIHVNIQKYTANQQSLVEAFTSTIDPRLLSRIFKKLSIQAEEPITNSSRKNKFQQFMDIYKLKRQREEHREHLRNVILSTSLSTVLKPFEMNIIESFNRLLAA